VKTHARLMMFSLIGSIAYTLAFYFDWSLFQYDLATHSVHFLAHDTEAGPPLILWYGWLATAVLAGGVFAAITPSRLSARLLPDLLWLIPVVLIFAAVLYEKRWFM